MGNEKKKLLLQFRFVCTSLLRMKSHTWYYRHSIKWIIKCVNRLCDGTQKKGVKVLENSLRLHNATLSNKIQNGIENNFIFGSQTINKHIFLLMRINVIFCLFVWLEFNVLPFGFFLPSHSSRFVLVDKLWFCWLNFFLNAMRHGMFQFAYPLKCIWFRNIQIG